MSLNKPPSSIRRRLTLSLLLGMGTVLIVAGASLDIFFSHRLLQGFDDTLRNRALALSILTEQEEEGIDFEFMDEPEPEYPKHGPQDYFQLWLQSGEVLSRSQSLGDANLPVAPLLAPEITAQNLVLPNGLAGRMLSIEFEPRIDDEAEAGSIQIQSVFMTVARERTSLDEALLITHLSLATTFAVLMGILILVTRYAIAQGLKPLDDIRDQVSSLNISALDSRLSPAIPTVELEGVVDQFNVLLEKMERAFNRERQFSADVAHELRTPLAELRNLAEVATRWPDDPVLAKDFYGDVLEATMQMEGITTQLLLLSRSEQIKTVPSKELFDLPDLIASVWGKIRNGRADVMMMPLSKGPETLELRSDPVIMELILSNLFENALTYGTGQVECEYFLDGEMMNLSISNPSTKLTSEDLPNLFDRFWRRDKSRTGGKHAGLGLSLVKSYTAMLGLNVAASLDESTQVFKITVTDLVK